MIIKKNAAEIAKMAASGLILAAAMDLIAENIKPGVTTAELDRIAERYIRSQGAVPTFKGYQGFPGSICASPNSLVVHGIPGAYKLQEGDEIAIDIGVTHEGWVADAARTFPVGAIDERSQKLLGATEGALYAGVAQARAGNRVGDISHAIQQHAEAAGLTLIEQLVGHGVGREMHEDPQVPNLGRPHRGPLLEPGVVIAIEPMTSAGRPDVNLGDDGWAVFTVDGAPSAHFEFTVAVTAGEPLILTPWNLPAQQRRAAIAPQESPAGSGDAA